MALEHIILFNVTLLAAILSPGPALVMAIRTILSAGRGAGIAMGCGLGLVAALWTAAALLGLEAVFTAFPWAYWAMKTLGAAYLIWIAVQMWRGAATPITADIKPARRAFRDGVMVQIVNPKSVLFAAAVLVVIFPRDLTLADKGLIVLNHFLVEIAFYTLLAFALSTQAAQRRYLAAKVYLDRGAALVMGALGLRLVFSR
jgi:threonine/homoserine/homoserine lactone efflux protein